MKRTASSYCLSFIHDDSDQTHESINALAEYLMRIAQGAIKNNEKIEDVWHDHDDEHTTYLRECIENGEL